MRNSGANRLLQCFPPIHTACTVLRSSPCEFPQWIVSFFWPRPIISPWSGKCLLNSWHCPSCGKRLLFITEKPWQLDYCVIEGVLLHSFWKHFPYICCETDGQPLCRKVVTGKTHFGATRNATLHLPPDFKKCWYPQLPFKPRGGINPHHRQKNQALVPLRKKWVNAEQTPPFPVFPSSSLYKMAQEQSTAEESEAVHCSAAQDGGKTEPGPCSTLVTAHLSPSFSFFRSQRDWWLTGTLMHPVFTV